MLLEDSPKLFQHFTNFLLQQQSLQALHTRIRAYVRSDLTRTVFNINNNLIKSNTSTLYAEQYYFAKAYFRFISLVDDKTDYYTALNDFDFGTALTVEKVTNLLKNWKRFIINNNINVNDFAIVNIEQKRHTLDDTTKKLIDALGIENLPKDYLDEHPEIVDYVNSKTNTETKVTDTGIDTNTNTTATDTITDTDINNSIEIKTDTNKATVKKQNTLLQYKANFDYIINTVLTMFAFKLLLTKTNVCLHAP